MPQNNIIHRIRFTPRTYGLPNGTFGKYLKTISGKFVQTISSSQKIKTNG